jgi:hypothetical protein
VSRLYCWRRRAAWFVEVCHEPVEVEVVQQVELHERKVCRRNFFALLQPCRHDRRCRGLNCSGCNVLLFPFRTDCEEAEFCSMRYYLATLFWWNNSWNYFWYSVEMTPQSNNDTTGSRLLNNMALPHIWLAQENITDIQWGNIT